MEGEKLKFVQAFRKMMLARQTVVDWMSKQSDAGELVRLSDAPGWSDYQAANDAWDEGAQGYAKYLLTGANSQ